MWCFQCVVLFMMLLHIIASSQWMQSVGLSMMSFADVAGNSLSVIWLHIAAVGANKAERL